MSPERAALQEQLKMDEMRENYKKNDKRVETQIRRGLDNAVFGWIFCFCNKCVVALYIWTRRGS